MDGIVEHDGTILELKDIVKRFPGVVALEKVSFDLRQGEVHALVGENGAGKSTLIKILSGAYQKDAGEILISGTPVEIQGPRHSQDLGISTVYQEFNLVPDLSVAENIFLGRQPIRGRILPTIDRRRMNTDAQRLLGSLNIDINPRRRIRDLGVAEKQMVEIVKVFSVKSRICIFDEPTATLTAEEIEGLFQVIDRFKAEGMGIIYISHRLEEVFRIADRITIMRNGQYVATKNRGDVTSAQLVEMMIGRKMEDVRFLKKRCAGEEVLAIRNLCGGRFNDVSFSVCRGEIVGLAGLVGAGRTEVLRAVFGADRAKSGEIHLYGRPVGFRQPQAAVRSRVALIPEDRKKQGLVMCRSVEENIVLASLDSVSRGGVLNKGRIRRKVQDFIKRLRIATPSQRQQVIYLSGGNQQKVIIAKWLSAESDLIMFDEPTRGIDVGAKQEVHQLMSELADGGKAVLVVSSEIPELLRICDRIYVMHEGCIVTEYANENLTSDRILNSAFGRRDAAGTSGAPEGAGPEIGSKETGR
jgi:ribose transport system ATP-binding protein